MHFSALQIGSARAITPQAFTTAALREVSCPYVNSLLHNMFCLFVQSKNYSWAVKILCFLLLVVNIFGVQVDDGKLDIAVNCYQFYLIFFNEPS